MRGADVTGMTAFKTDNITFCRRLARCLLYYNHLPNGA